MFTSLNLAKDKSMVEEGIMLSNKGIRLGTHAFEELEDGYTDEDALGLGCYLLSQSIELILKGLCILFGEQPQTNHVIKYPARTLKYLSNRRVPELVRIQESLEEISSNDFSYVIQTWNAHGRYDFLIATRDYIDRAEIVFSDLKRFILNYHILEIVS